MAGTIVVDRIESDASYASTINVANKITFSNTVTHSSGTANGVAFLNSSKALTTGSALVFDGTNFSTTGTIKGTSTISVGAATPSTSGAGITFPATQSASSDANTLDDYEEGTWTPSLGGNTTYNTQLGQYTKIGRQVTVTASLIVTTLGTGSTTTISGLPFSTNATSISGNAVAKFSNLAVNVIGLNALALDGTVTTIRFTYISASGGANTYDPALFGNNANVFFSLTYFVN